MLMMFNILVRINESVFMKKLFILFLVFFTFVPNVFAVNLNKAKEFEKLKIKVYDKDYDKIDKDLREIIFLLNSY